MSPRNRINGHSRLINPTMSFTELAATPPLASRQRTNLKTLSEGTVSSNRKGKQITYRPHRSYSLGSSHPTVVAQLAPPDQRQSTFLCNY